MESAKWFAVAVGVGHNEDSISMMRSPKVSGRQTKWHAGIPESVQVEPHEGHPIAPRLADVLNEDDRRLELSDASDALAPPPGPFATEPLPLLDVRRRQVLTRKATGDDVYAFRRLRIHVDDVVEDTDAWEVVREHASAPRIFLSLPRNTQVLDCVFEPEVDTADTAEE